MCFHVFAVSPCVLKLLMEHFSFFFFKDNKLFFSIVSHFLYSLFHPNFNSLNLELWKKGRGRALEGGGVYRLDERGRVSESNVYQFQF